MNNSVDPTEANNITTLPIEFLFEKKPVKTKLQNGQVWFAAKDVCDILGLKNSSQAINILDDDERGFFSSETSGGVQNLAAINESGLYSLIFRSNKPNAKRFRKWVTSEVLPQIRETGQYRPPANGLRLNYCFIGDERNDAALTRTINVLLVSHKIRSHTANLLKNIDRIEAIGSASEQNARTFVASTLKDEDVSIQCPQCRGFLQDQHIISDHTLDTARILAIKAQELAIECRRARASIEALRAGIASGDDEERAFFNAVAVDPIDQDGNTFKAPPKNSDRPL